MKMEFFMSQSVESTNHIDFMCFTKFKSKQKAQYDIDFKRKCQKNLKTERGSCSTQIEHGPLQRSQTPPAK